MVHKLRVLWKGYRDEGPAQGFLEMAVFTSVKNSKTSKFLSVVVVGYLQNSWLYAYYVFRLDSNGKTGAMHRVPLRGLCTTVPC